MLKTSEAFSGFAVPDTAVARTFYEEVLGIEVEEAHDMLTLKLGDTSVLVYPKGDHEPATFTILNIPVDDIDAAIDDLVAKGVEFEHYDGQMPTDEKGVLRGKERDMGPNIAWFRDPGGNILSVIED